MLSNRVTLAMGSVTSKAIHHNTIVSKDLSRPIRIITF